MADYETIAKQFIQQFYNIYDSNRADLQNFYHESSVLSFENSGNLIGREKIHAKFTSLPFQRVQHAVTTIDAQPTRDGGLLVVVIGQLQTDDDPKMPFSATFYLKQAGDSLFIDNHFFRLGLHNF